MPIRMLALDLDGTLLHDDKTLSEFTIAQLRRCQALGIKVVFATARSHRAAARFLAMFDADGLILSGGATASAGGELVASALIPAQVADNFIGRSMHIKGIQHILLAGEDSSLTNDPRAPQEKDSAHYRYSDFVSLPHQNAYKITLITLDMDALRRLADEFDSLTFTSYTGEDMHAFSSKRAVKDIALRALAGHFGIAMDEVAAFGNDVNDVGMLKACGVGVAVDNAVDELKAVADEVCGVNNEDGVAWWIAKRVIS